MKVPPTRKFVSAAWNARGECSSPLLPQLSDDAGDRVSPSMPMPEIISPRQPPPPLLPTTVWKNALYEKQPFEDNYVDPVQFLQEMRKNANLAEYNYNDVVRDTFVVIQQVSIAVIFTNMFAVIVTNQVSLITNVVMNVVTLASFGIGYAALSNDQSQTHKDEPGASSNFVWIKQMLVLILMLILLSPVFQTLTVTYSDDTIWALAIISMFVHILATDYDYLNGYHSTYEHNLSVNAATFGSILMASRIRSAMFGGALISFGILCFTLSPILRHMIKKFSLIAHVAVTFSLCGIAAGCLLKMPLLAVLFTTAVVLICFVIPWFFVKLQKHAKYQINGPWDEAKPQNSAAAAEWANAGLLG